MSSLKTLVYVVITFTLLTIGIAGTALAEQALTGTEQITVPDEFSETNNPQWVRIEQNIVSTNYKVYVLHWHGFGGLVEMAHTLETAMLNAESQGKAIIIDVDGNSYSCHAIVLAYATQVIHADEHIIMFHADGYNQYRMSQADSSTVSDFAKCVAKGILTQHDVNTLWEGYEVWYINGHVNYVVDIRPVAPWTVMFGMGQLINRN